MDPQAELALDGYGDAQAVVKARKTFENVLRMVNSGEMPPAMKLDRTRKSQMRLSRTCAPFLITPISMPNLNPAA